MVGIHGKCGSIGLQWGSAADVPVGSRRKAPGQERGFVPKADKISVIVTNFFALIFDSII
jgi:hypothetical protein